MGRQLFRSVAVAALLAGSGIAVGSAPAASADDGTVWVGQPTAASLRVTSGSCRSIPVAISYGTTRYDVDVDVEVEIWRRSSYLGSTSLYLPNGPTGLKGDYYWCPFEGLGTFKVNPVRVEWLDWDTYETGSFTRVSNTRFTVRQASWLSRSVVKRGKKRTFTGRLTYYSMSTYDRRGLPRVTVALQRKKANGTWKTIKTAKTNARGKVTIVRSASSRATYRLSYGGGSTVWGTTSRAVRR